jgi:ribosomal protein S17
MQKTKKLFYRYTSLISYDTFEKSKINFQHYKHPSTKDYTTDNIKKTIIISDERKSRIVNIQYKNYSNNVYGKNYKHSNEFYSIMKNLKTNNPDTNFIIFTTPISAQLFKLLVEKGNLKDYKKWLKKISDIFPVVYNFMGINSVTSNQKNYPDLHHFYPNVGDMIANRISNNNRNSKKDFGILIIKK